MARSRSCERSWESPLRIPERHVGIEMATGSGPGTALVGTWTAAGVLRTVYRLPSIVPTPRASGCVCMRLAFGRLPSAERGWAGRSRRSVAASVRRRAAIVFVVCRSHVRVLRALPSGWGGGGYAPPWEAVFSPVRGTFSTSSLSLLNSSTHYSQSQRTPHKCSTYVLITREIPSTPRVDFFFMEVECSRAA
eukprot:scaffold13334_cov79-Isochrysis_galbana.AAC.1